MTKAYIMRDKNVMIRLDYQDLSWMSDVLTSAFLNINPYKQIFTGADHKRLTYFFIHFICKYTLKYGECYTTAEKSGVALWLKPERSYISFFKACYHGMYAAPFKMGPKAFFYFMMFVMHISRIHSKCMPIPHYYLVMLGVSPEKTKQGIGTQLVTCMFERISADKIPVYVETQNSENLGFYQKMGFEMLAQKSFPLMPTLINWSFARL